MRHGVQVLRRSLKVLAALAAGCWLVSTRYLDNCGKYGKLLPPVRSGALLLCLPAAGYGACVLLTAKPRQGCSAFTVWWAVDNTMAQTGSSAHAAGII